MIITLARTMKALSIVLLVLVLTNTIASTKDTYSDYDECILENLKGVTSDEAAKLIYKSCRNKFPYPWVENDKVRNDSANYERDRYECELDAAMIPSPSENSAFYKKRSKTLRAIHDRNERKKLLERCMKAKGW